MELKGKFILVQNFFELHAYKGSSKSSWRMCVMKKLFTDTNFLLAPK